MSSISCGAERAAELADNLQEIRLSIQQSQQAIDRQTEVTLVAVSKLKPASDVQGCYEAGQRAFGENYVQELCEKAPQLASDIEWHFIGTLQSNKCKALAEIPNIAAVHTVTSAKAATTLNKHLPASRATLLDILLQVNTSGEASKSGLAPLATDSGADVADGSDLTQLALHVVRDCPRLRLVGLMTIGALGASLGSNDREGNQDFISLVNTRNALQVVLSEQAAGKTWGRDGQLLLSMGMSSDYDAAIKAGSDVVRVGTSIFGTRQKK
ncbi:hypothetical protein BKA62DRAFT_833303 [Auriculariales sp. MPI-PUGE-AT-0066]|nr:hypothetical protein BKA62DRAFT_833303 [Auriculariales sp. MPI-PUGE-AT-0066]